MSEGNSNSTKKLIALWLNRLIGFISLLGLYPACFWIFSKLAFYRNPGTPDQLWGWNVELWSGIAGTLFIFFGLVGIRFYGAQLLVKELTDHLAATERRVDELLVESLNKIGVSARFRQKRAFDELCSLFGYHIEHAKYHLTVYSSQDATNGRGESVFDIALNANHRSLGSWQRAVRCKSAVPTGAYEFSIDPPFKITREFVPLEDSSVVVERFVFDPTVSNKKVVGMQLKEKFAPNSFLTKPTADKTEDEVTFLVGGPMHHLELVVEFDGFHPVQRDIRADACIGRAKEIFIREAIDVSESLQIGPQGTRQTATFCIEHPIVGVTYRLIWKCR